MIYLIVNADDLGINPARDRGIIEAYQNGIVSSATMIANGLSFTTATNQAKATGLPTGIHLNLSDGVTLSGPINRLTDLSGTLPGKVSLRKYLLEGDVDLAAIRREFSAQIERVMTAGMIPTHLDGHQHCHIYPCLTDMVIDLAEKYGLDKIRSVCQAKPEETKIPEDLVDDIVLFSRLGQAAHDRFKIAGLKTPKGLWGLPQLHSLDLTSLCGLLNNLPEGCWELMCHPGYPYPQGSVFEGEQRLKEVQALCSREVQEAIMKRQIRLCNFGDLPCG